MKHDARERSRKATEAKLAMVRQTAVRLTAETGRPVENLTWASYLAHANVKPLTR